MYVLNDFSEALRSFFRSNADLDIDVKLLTSKQSVNGDVRFYAAKVSYRRRVTVNAVTGPTERCEP